MNKNIVLYVNDNGNKSFDEYPINEIDILIFTILSYNNFSILSECKINIFKNLYNDLIKNNSMGNGSARDDGYIILKAISNKKRYSNIKLYNYKYEIGKDYQFGAITIIAENILYIIFEGTDATIPGWKEDFSISYKYPVKAHELAIQYINDVLKKTKMQCVISGHSKGGNLALIASMNIKKSLMDRVLKVYSFDGPGLRDEEYNSKNYKLIKNKLINIVPNQSIIGMILNQDNIVTILSNEIGIMQHSALTWQVSDNKLVRTNISDFSKNIKSIITNWLNNYDYNDREKITNGLFLLFEENGIKSFPELGENKIKNILEMIKTSVTMDKNTRLFILESLKDLVKQINMQLLSSKKEKTKRILENLENDINTYLSIIKNK